MEVLYRKDYHGDYENDPKIIGEIKLTDRRILNIIRYFEDVDEKDLLNVLNSINNQGIQSIDLRTYSYVNRNETLAFEDLCSAEKIFLVAYMADKKKQKIYLTSCDIGSLTDTTFKHFIRTFWNSEYVNIMYNYETSRSYYNYIVKEALA